MPILLLLLLNMVALATLSEQIKEKAVRIAYQKAHSQKKPTPMESASLSLSAPSLIKNTIEKPPQQKSKNSQGVEKNYTRYSSPPKNAKLNLLLARHSPEVIQQAVHKLIDSLYQQTDLQLPKKNVSAVIIEHVLHSCHSPHDLGLLKIEEQETLYKMLKGKKGKYPSLLDYVTIIDTPRGANKGKLNIHYAHPLLLECLFGSKSLSRELIEARLPKIKSQARERERLLPLLEKHLDLAGVQQGLSMLDFTHGLKTKDLPPNEGEGEW